MLITSYIPIDLRLVFRAKAILFGCLFWLHLWGSHSFPCRSLISSTSIVNDFMNSWFNEVDEQFTTSCDIRNVFVNILDSDGIHYIHVDT